MLISEAARQHWEHHILHDEEAARDALRELQIQDRVHFLAVLRSLAVSTRLEVRRVGLRMLSFYGERDDAVAEAAAREALQLPALQNVALQALGKVGTSASFRTLLPFAEAGSVQGLGSASMQARTEDEQRQVLELARRFILGDDFHLRMIALRCLQRRSRPELDEDLLVEAVRRHPDELVIGALSHATSRVLPALRDLYNNYPPSSAEAYDLAQTLHAIEMRTQAR